MFLLSCVRGEEFVVEQSTRFAFCACARDLASLSRVTWLDFASVSGSGGDGAFFSLADPRVLA